MQGDVRELKDCLAAVQAVTEKWGHLDILINAAAGNFLAPAEVLTPKGFKTGTRPQSCAQAAVTCTGCSHTHRLQSHACTTGQNKRMWMATLLFVPLPGVTGNNVPAD